MNAIEKTISDYEKQCRQHKTAFKYQLIIGAFAVFVQVFLIVQYDLIQETSNSELIELPNEYSPEVVGAQIQFFTWARETALYSKLIPPMLILTCFLIIGGLLAQHRQNKLRKLLIHLYHESKSKG